MDEGRGMRDRYRRSGRTWSARSIAAAVFVAALFGVGVQAIAAPGDPVDPELESRNFAKTSEREQYVTLTPEFQARLVQANAEAAQSFTEIATSDPERVFAGNVCANNGNECAGDVRFHDWEDTKGAISEPVLWTQRNGSTINGRVWATKRGPSKRPLAVITNGSVQAPQQLYWGQAAALARHGYVVVTWDPQGQGRSDTFGDGVDRLDGVPSQEGRPFYDGTEDALDFALSTPRDEYVPRKSCTSGTSHADKQARRVEDGLNAGFNPLWRLVDRKRVGIAGHSLGAAAVSYVGQIDRRVDAVAAWDNLQAPGGGPAGGVGDRPECASGSSPRPRNPQITRPALGITNDYSITPAPNTEVPDPQRENEGFSAYRKSGVDSMQLAIRGGTHEESAFIPGNTTGYLGLASLRGNDMVGWYTTAWFDKYVKCAGRGAECARSADDRLLTERWRRDARSRGVDANSDRNALSFYLRSRYALRTAAGELVRCANMRRGCESMSRDRLFRRGYDLVSDAYRAFGRGSVGGEACALPGEGSGANDTRVTLPPSDAGDSLRGNGGDDVLHGGPGDDCLAGGPGEDKLRCGPGEDSYVPDPQDKIGRDCESPLAGAEARRFLSD
ncbi:hypothetical protein HJD18_08900 [Thermoleophilia bacterium SCSIO 60948]|nr:hypothetical protein HJD18_08900 [Thermoleophilia bacterium SCSIO 60948]